MVASVVRLIYTIIRPLQAIAVDQNPPINVQKVERVSPFADKPCEVGLDRPPLPSICLEVLKNKGLHLRVRVLPEGEEAWYDDIRSFALTEIVEFGARNVGLLVLQSRVSSVQPKEKLGTHRGE